MPELTYTDDGRLQFVGNFNEMPIGSLLLWVLNEQHQGELTLHYEGFTQVLYFLRGYPVGSRGGPPENFLGWVFRETGVIDDGTYLQSLQTMATEQKLQGQVLIGMGAINEQQLSDALKLQLQRKILRIFRANQGDFQFVSNSQMQVQDIAPGLLNPYTLIANGVRQEYTDPRMEQFLQRFEGHMLKRKVDHMSEKLLEKLGLLDVEITALQLIEGWSTTHSFIASEYLDRTPSLALLTILTMADLVIVKEYDEMAIARDKRRTKTPLAGNPSPAAPVDGSSPATTATHSVAATAEIPGGDTTADSGGVSISVQTAKDPRKQKDDPNRPRTRAQVTVNIKEDRIETIEAMAATPENLEKIAGISPKTSSQPDLAEVNSIEEFALPTESQFELEQTRETITDLPAVTEETAASAPTETDAVPFESNQATKPDFDPFGTDFPTTPSAPSLTPPPGSVPSLTPPPGSVPSLTPPPATASSSGTQPAAVLTPPPSSSPLTQPNIIAGPPPGTGTGGVITPPPPSQPSGAASASAPNAAISMGPPSGSENQGAIIMGPPPTSDSNAAILAPPPPSENKGAVIAGPPPGEGQGAIIMGPPPGEEKSAIIMGPPPGEPSSSPAIPLGPTTPATPRPAATATPTATGTSSPSRPAFASSATPAPRSSSTPVAGGSKSWVTATPGPRSAPARATVRPAATPIPGSRPSTATATPQPRSTPKASPARGVAAPSSRSSTTASKPPASKSAVASNSLTEDEQKKERLVKTKREEIDSGCNYYELLEVERYAGLPAIRDSYYKLSRMFHPDGVAGTPLTHLSEDLELIFSHLNTAYSTLSNKTMKREYDEELEDPEAAAMKDRAPKAAQAEVNYTKSLVYLKQRNYKKAEEEIRWATQLLEDEGDYQAVLAWAIYNNDDYDKAEGLKLARYHFEQAEQFNADPEKLRYYMGLLEKAEGNFEEALIHFNELLRHNPRHTDGTREMRNIKVLQRREREKDKSVEEEKPKPKKSGWGSLFKK